jgi:trypsin
MFSTMLGVLAFTTAACGEVSFDRLSADLLGALDEHRRIVGGSVAPKSSRPYMLSLQASGAHFCGAVLISSSRAITTASCVANHHRDFTVVGGAHNIKQNESTQQKKTGTVVLHPGYNSRTFLNDIAVIKIDGTFNLNNNVAAMAMPSHKNGEWMPNGAAVTTCGWGNTRTGPIGSYPNELHCVNYNIISNADCNSRNVYDGKVQRGMQCAGVTNGGKSMCTGDAGGPIVYNNQVIGVQSWNQELTGLGCAQANQPDVFTDVAVYRNWIDGI